MIFRRYIHREILEKAGWIIALLLLVLSSNRFVDYLADAAGGDLPGDLLFQMLGMKMLASLPKLLPLALFLAVILALSRLARDRELSVVTAAGVPGSFQFWTVSQVAVLFAGLIFVISFFIAPWAELRLATLREQAKVEADVSGLSAGQFREFSEGERVVYVEHISADKARMLNVFVQVRRDAYLGLLNADSAHYSYSPVSGSRYVVFQRGRRYIGSPGDPDYQITEYRSYALLLNAEEQGIPPAKLETLSSASLLGSKVAGHKAEMQWRISYVLTTLLLPLLAVALHRFAFSERRYTFIFAAIMIYFLYSNLLGISKSLVRRDKLSPYIGLWWVHLILILLIILIVQFPAIQRWYRQRKIQRKMQGDP